MSRNRLNFSRTARKRSNSSTMGGDRQQNHVNGSRDSGSMAQTIPGRITIVPAGVSLLRDSNRPRFWPTRGSGERNSRRVLWIQIKTDEGRPFLTTFIIFFDEIIFITNMFPE